jgi:hypothetical protein
MSYEAHSCGGTALAQMSIADRSSTETDSLRSGRRLATLVGKRPLGGRGPNRSRGRRCGHGAATRRAHTGAMLWPWPGRLVADFDVPRMPDDET